MRIKRRNKKAEENKKRGEIMKQYKIKAKIKNVPEGRNRIRKHIFAENEENALGKFRNIYNKSENIDWEQVEFESIEEVKNEK